MCIRDRDRKWRQRSALRQLMVLALTLTLVLVLTLALAPSGMINKKGMITSIKKFGVVVVILVSNALGIRRKTAKPEFQLDYKIGFKLVLGGKWRHARYMKR